MEPLIYEQVQVFSDTTACIVVMRAPSRLFAPPFYHDYIFPRPEDDGQYPSGLHANAVRRLGSYCFLSVCIFSAWNAVVYG